MQASAYQVVDDDNDNDNSNDDTGEVDERKAPTSATQ